MIEFYQVGRTIVVRDVASGEIATYTYDSQTMADLVFAVMLAERIAA